MDTTIDYPAIGDKAELNRLANVIVLEFRLALNPVTVVPKILIVVRDAGSDVEKETWLGIEMTIYPPAGIVFFG